MAGLHLRRLLLRERRHLLAGRFQLGQRLHPGRSQRRGRRALAFLARATAILAASYDLKLGSRAKLPALGLLQRPVRPPLPLHLQRRLQRRRPHHQRPLLRAGGERRESGVHERHRGGLGGLRRGGRGLAEVPRSDHGEGREPLALDGPARRPGGTGRPRVASQARAHLRHAELPEPPQQGLGRRGLRDLRRPEPAPGAHGQLRRPDGLQPHQHHARDLREVRP